MGFRAGDAGAWDSHDRFEASGGLTKDFSPSKTARGQGISLPGERRAAMNCAECGEPILGINRKAKFCSAKCRYRQRDRKRYQADPEGERAKSRAYYAA